MAENVLILNYKCHARQTKFLHAMQIWIPVH